MHDTLFYHTGLHEHPNVPMADTIGISSASGMETVSTPASQVGDAAPECKCLFVHNMLCNCSQNLLLFSSGPTYTSGRSWPPRLCPDAFLIPSCRCHLRFEAHHQEGQGHQIRPHPACQLLMHWLYEQDTCCAQSQRPIQPGHSSRSHVQDVLDWFNVCLSPF